MTRGPDGSLVTLLVLKDRRTGCLAATQVPAKSAEPYTLGFTVGRLRGLRYKCFILASWWELKWSSRQAQKVTIRPMDWLRSELEKSRLTEAPSWAESWARARLERTTCNLVGQTRGQLLDSLQGASGRKDTRPAQNRKERHKSAEKTYRGAVGRRLEAYSGSSKERSLHQQRRLKP
eukprot:5431223-Amphidinium_carterae.1